MRLTERAHALVVARLTAGAWAIDATIGNGHDTVFLARAVGPNGRVFAFDIQQRALDLAKLRLGDTGSRVTFHLCGHEHMAARLPQEARGRIAAVMFNLGYLPGGDKAVVTRAATTVAALDAARDLVGAGGIITVMAYRGHDGGSDEADHVLSWAARCASPWTIQRYDAAPSVGRTADTTPFLLMACRPELELSQRPDSTSRFSLSTR